MDLVNSSGLPSGGAEQLQNAFFVERMKDVYGKMAKAVQANITGADKKLVSTEVQVDAREKDDCQTIKRSFAQLKAVLDQREMKLLNEAASLVHKSSNEQLNKAVILVQEKGNALMAQRKGLQMAERQIQNLMKVESTSDQDLMVIRTQLQAKVEEEEKCHQQLSLEPATTADITYDPPPPDAIPKDIGNGFSQLFWGKFPQSCHQPE